MFAAKADMLLHKLSLCMQIAAARPMFLLRNDVILHMHVVQGVLSAYYVPHAAHVRSYFAKFDLSNCFCHVNLRLCTLFYLNLILVQIISCRLLKRG
jgi:hypothetical protein